MERTTIDCGRHSRQVTHRWHSQAALAGPLDELYEQARLGLEEWKVGDLIPGGPSCKRLMSSQVSRLAVDVDTSDYILDLAAYKERSLQTHVQRSLPKFMLRTPGMKKKRKKIFELFELIQVAHTPALCKGKPRVFVDDMLSLYKSDPQFLPKTEMLFVLVTPLIASIYLGSALAFAIYSMVSNPDLYGRVQAEAEALFGNGDLDREDLNMAAIDVTHRLIMESHRLHTVLQVTIRHVMNTFNMEGYEIPVGSNVLIAKAAAHYLDENYPDPLKFDVDRYLPSREEHKKRGAYAPFELGTHICLGPRWVELQMVVNLLMNAYYFQIELHPWNFQMQYNPFPTSGPARKLKFAITKKRHEL